MGMETEYTIKQPDLWTELNVHAIPEYLGGLAAKYNMRFKVICSIQTAMYNDKCCLIFGIDRCDGVILSTTMRENGERIEYPINNFIVSKFDASDRVGIVPKFDTMSDKIKAELTIFARGLDSKWSNLLRGDMRWFEDYKKSGWYYKEHYYIEIRNRILDEILDWQQSQAAGKETETH
ncbi:MAG: hypothetical protein J5532_07885 [Lachnospiraceae bacterium]|nr:hypothetical protein [Lachnospiraceae bacterium]